MNSLIATSIFVLAVSSVLSHVRAAQLPLLNTVVEGNDKRFGRFLHITDMHLDPYYEEGAPIATSCHGTADVFVARKKRPQIDATAGKYGTPGSGCDSPLVLINETMRFIAGVLNAGDRLDFVVWTGDSARHDSDSRIARTEGEIQALNALAVEFLLGAFSSVGERGSIPIVPNIGNNDIWPHNDLVYTPSVPNPTLDFYATLWKPFIPADQIEEFRRHGSFAVEVAPNVVVASINTMYLSDGNKQVDDCRESKDGPLAAGDDVLQWLANVLNAARQDRKAVYVAGHVPPTPINFYPNCYERFSKLMIDYTDVVTGQFYGHMNIDHFFFPTPANAVGEDLTSTPERGEIEESLRASMPYFSASSLAPLTGPLPPQAGGTVGTTIPSWLNLYCHYLIRHYTELVHQIKKNPDLRVPQPVFVSPSVVPSFNPSLRVFEYRKGMDDVQPTVGHLIGYTQYFADIEKWNKHSIGDMTVQNQEFPGYIYETEYRPVSLYGLEKFDAEEWLRFGGRMAGIGTDKNTAAQLRELYLANLVVRLKGLKVPV
ncbi:hypothetical protein SpCBS45565_g06423 [Spizellomyces sp. 'palustris']|nr:hypothetical protein SpCBS45565_g06423 [Spizellomyces sp. 'palustris']